MDKLEPLCIVGWNKNGHSHSGKHTYKFGSSKKRKESREGGREEGMREEEVREGGRERKGGGRKEGKKKQN